MKDDCADTDPFTTAELDPHGFPEMFAGVMGGFFAAATGFVIGSLVGLAGRHSLAAATACFVVGGTVAGWYANRSSTLVRMTLSEMFDTVKFTAAAVVGFGLVGSLLHRATTGVVDSPIAWLLSAIVGGGVVFYLRIRRFHRMLRVRSSAANEAVR